MPIALVLGATGLVGRALTELLLRDVRWEQVHTFVRRPSGIANSKLSEHVINFDKRESWEHLVKGDVLFSALGTTLATAGSKEAQYKVDHTYQFQFADAAVKNGVRRYVLVSASNASLQSWFFYPRLKAGLERDVLHLPFESTSVMRPGLLTGPRTEHRKGEKLAQKLAGVLQHVPGLGAFKTISAAAVAKAMITAGLDQKETKRIYDMQEMEAMAATYRF